MIVDPIERRIWWLVDSHQACVGILDDWLQREATRACLDDIHHHLEMLGVGPERRSGWLSRLAKAPPSFVWRVVESAREMVAERAEGGRR